MAPTPNIQSTGDRARDCASFVVKFLVAFLVLHLCTILACVGLVFVVKTSWDPLTIFFILAPASLAFIGSLLGIIPLMRMRKIRDEVSPV